MEVENMNGKFFRHTAAGIMSLALILNSSGVVSYPAAKAADSGITINEICAKNSQYAAPDNGFYDWVELYNGTGNTVDISGWGLTDKDTKPYRYTFPDGTSIAPGGRLLVFCDSTAGTTNTSIAPFSLSTSGETITLTDKGGSQVSTVTFGAVAADTSYGQYPDGSGEFYTLTCSPNEANKAPEGSDAVRQPEFSAPSGFYGSEFDLTITAPQGTKIVYTLDGSTPSADSEAYTGPIHIKDRSNEQNVLSARTDISASDVKAPQKNVDKAMVVRAAAVDDAGNVSEPITATYFVGKTYDSYYRNMKVVSLVTDPDNIFDYEKGIYVKGKIFDEENRTAGGWGGWGGMLRPWEMAANYTQKGRDWERVASFELFDNGKPVVAQDMGIRIKGGATRNNAQKSFNVYARLDYGKENFEYDLFDGKAVKVTNGKTITKFDSFTLRNGGNDSSYAFFRDCINQQLASDRDFSIQNTSECMVFIDGEFWGIYQLTEKLSDDYFKNHYDIKKSNVVIVKNNELEEGTEEDLSDWKSLAEMCANSDMSNAENYAKFTEKVDVQSYIDYFAAQIYWNNWDWPNNNFAVWRTNVTDDTNPYADGKWRMFLFDTEYSTNLYEGQQTSPQTDAFARIKQNKDNDSRMFISLLNNAEFKEQFALTMLDLGNYNLTSDKADKLIEYYKSTYRTQVLDTFSRFYSDWLDGAKGEQQFDKEMSAVSQFYKSRFEPAANSLSKAIGVNGELGQLSLYNDSNSGTLTLNTLTFDESLSGWNGKYFVGSKLTLKAAPKSGSRFSHWEVNGKEVTGSTLSLTMERNTEVKAVYDKSVKGDYNGDGSRGVADLVALQNFVLGKDVEIVNADVVEDGLTDSFDLAALRRLLITG